MVYHGFTMGLPWVYHGFTMGLKHAWFDQQKSSWNKILTIKINGGCNPAGDQTWSVCWRVACRSASSEPARGNSYDSQIRAITVHVHSGVLLPPSKSNF